MEYAFDGVADKFKFQRNLTDEALLARARAFITETESYETDFIAYGLPATFTADLIAAADAFEASFSQTASAQAEHIAATADISAVIRQGMIIVRTLDAVVTNIFASNPGKLAAWNSASHVEKPPKPKAPVPPEPPEEQTPRAIRMRFRTARLIYRNSASCSFRKRRSSRFVIVLASWTVLSMLAFE